MPVYKCPQCHADGFIEIEGDWDEWMLKNFGEFHTHNPTDVLPLECDRCKRLTPLARKMMNQVIEQKGYESVKPQPMRPTFAVPTPEQIEAYNSNHAKLAKWGVVQEEAAAEDVEVVELSKEEKDANFRRALEQLKAASGRATAAYAQPKKVKVSTKKARKMVKKKVDRSESSKKAWETRRRNMLELQLKQEAARMKRSIAAKKAWKKRKT